MPRLFILWKEGSRTELTARMSSIYPHADGDKPAELILHHEDKAEYIELKDVQCITILPD